MDFLTHLHAPACGGSFLAGLTAHFALDLVLWAFAGIGVVRAFKRISCCFHRHPHA